MFDVITGNVTHAPRPRTAPVLVSIAVHGFVVGAILVGTVMVVTAPVPELPAMMAFVASPPPPPPPPPVGSRTEEDGAGQGTADVRRRSTDRAATGDRA